MWQVKLVAFLSKFAGPLIGAVAAVILSLSVALWWTNSRLDAARATLADVRGDLLTCTRANASASAAIDELLEAQARNRAQLENAIRRQQAAVARIAELERKRNEQRDERIERVIRIADGDACANLPMPADLGLWLNAGSDRVRDD